MIVCKCPACSKAYKVRDELAGKSAKCPCGNRFVIPAASEVSAPPASPEPAHPAPREAPPSPSHAEPATHVDNVAETRSQPVEQPRVTETPASTPAESPQAAPVARTEPQPAPPVIQPQRTVAFEPLAAAGAPAPAAKDEGNGGVGRITFILALVFVTIIGAILGMMARHSAMGMRMVALVWLAISAVAMFIVTQARLISIGYNEWLALLLPVMIGAGVLLPEGFKGTGRNSPKKSNAGALMAGSVAITVGFLAACAGFAYYLVYIA